MTAVTNPEVVRFLVEGSSGDHYTVTFRKLGDNLSAFCTCSAGQTGMYCKHRIIILQGRPDDIVSENPEQVRIVVGWLHGTDIALALDAVAEAEQNLERAKAVVKEAKKALAVAMRD